VRIKKEMEKSYKEDIKNIVWKRYQRTIDNNKAIAEFNQVAQKYEFLTKLEKRNVVRGYLQESLSYLSWAPWLAREMLQRIIPQLAHHFLDNPAAYPDDESKLNAILEQNLHQQLKAIAWG